MAVTARRRLAAVSRALGPPTLLVAICVTVLAGAVPLGVQYAILLAGGLAVGMPHGALDWAALPLARRGRLDPWDLSVVGLLYAVLGGAALLVWVTWPAAGAVSFLALTWFHWGQGDVYTLRVDYGATYLGDATGRALTGLVRGGIPMVVPVVAFPETYRRVLATFVRPFGDRGGFAWLVAPEWRLALGGALLAATVLALARGRLRDADGSVWRWDVAETVSLWLAFLVVPPVLAIGLYFAVWHSWRHLARLAVLDGPTADAIAAGRSRRPLGRFAAAAILPTVAALGLGGVLWAAVPTPPTTVPGLAGLGLVVVAVLTVPHTAIVTWLDRLPSPGSAAG